MFNDDQSARRCARLLTPHATTGTTAVLIFDHRLCPTAAIDVLNAIAEGSAVLWGIHLEGPHPSVAAPAACDANLIRPRMRYAKTCPPAEGCGSVGKTSVARQRTMSPNNQNWWTRSWCHWAAKTPIWALTRSAARAGTYPVQRDEPTDNANCLFILKGPVNKTFMLV
jgi:hypothetical protein